MREHESFPGAVAGFVRSIESATKLPVTLRATMESSGWPLDARGLVALDEARRVVEAATAIRRETKTRAAGALAVDGERLWACLLSLGDVQEFTRHVERLVWLYFPRRHLEPLERYGRDIEPWVRAHLRDTTLHNVPPFILTLLCELGGQDNFELLLRVERVVNLKWDGSANEVTGTFESEDAAADALEAFVETNAVPGFAFLAQRALDGHERAREVIERTYFARPERVRDALVTSLGESAANAVIERLELDVSPTIESVLEVFDAATENEDDAWPTFFGEAAERAYHALRLVVFRQREGDDWLVAFETLEGSSEETLVVRRYGVSRFGAAMLEAEKSCELFVDGDWSDSETNEIVGPEGTLTFEPGDEAELEPTRFTTSDEVDGRYTIVVRAYLRENPTAFWTDEAGLRAAFEAEGGELDDHELLLESTAFEHVVGLPPDGEGLDVDGRWQIEPSQSPVYRSLARAIVERDASLFEPGVSNLDWRQHLGPPTAR